MASLVYYGFRMRPSDIIYDCLPLYHSAGNPGPPRSLQHPRASGTPPFLAGSICSQIRVQIQTWPLTRALNEAGHTSLMACVAMSYRTPGLV